MRLIVCLIPLLVGGCATPAVKCDAHLTPINAAAARAGEAATSASASAAAKPRGAGDRRTP